MSERYSRLFSLPPNLYSAGAPVIVAAGALLKDNQTGNILAQLKLQSITYKVIKATKVQITSFDTFGNPLEKTTEKEFLDLSVSRDQFFGAKASAVLPGTSARSYSVRVLEVAFVDGTFWKDNGGEWKPLTAQNELEDELGDNELVKQYRLTFGEKCRFLPLREQGLWFCSCGGINREGEKACHVCHSEIEKLQSVDFNALKAEKQARLEEEARKAREEIIAAEKARKKRNKILAIVGAVATVCIAIVILINSVIIPNGKYKEALTLMESGKYDEAISAFEALDGYRKSEEKISECKYKEAFEVLALAKADDTAKAAIAFGQIGDYSDAREQSLKLWEKCADRKTISAGEYHTVGLRSDGTVVAIGYNSYGQCDISKWENIVAVSAGYRHTVGLRSDGTVVAIGYNEYGQCDVSEWKNIVAVSAGGGHTIGLRSNGTVVATGYNSYGQCDVSEWKNIVAVSAGYRHTVGLRSDGTVVAIGYNEDGQCDVGKWKNIVAVSAGGNHTVGLRSDGTVVAKGDNEAEQCNVSKWKNIKLPQKIR